MVAVLIACKSSFADTARLVHWQKASFRVPTCMAGSFVRLLLAAIVSSEVRCSYEVLHVLSGRLQPGHQLLLQLPCAAGAAVFLHTHVKLPRNCRVGANVSKQPNCEAHRLHLHSIWTHKAV